jgi:hypothetical protein
VKLALFAMFLHALTPWGNACPLNGERNSFTSGIEICTAFKSEADQAPSAPVKPGHPYACDMCLAHPVAASAVLAVAVAVIMAPEVAVSGPTTIPQALLVSRTFLKTKAPRAPPASRV